MSTTSRATPQFKEWVEKARATNLDDVLRQYNVRLTGRSSNLVGPCPGCGGTDRFSVHLGKQVFNCRRCGARGRDAIALACLIEGLDRRGRDFLRAVEAVTGEPPPIENGNYWPVPDRERKLAQQRAHAERDRAAREAEQRKHEHRQREKARWLWKQRQPIACTLAERYLREARRCAGPLPPTLAFLPPSRSEHHPAMIAAFGIPDEPAPGMLGEPRNVSAVHLTLLRPDGKGKAAIEAPKITVGSPVGMPLVLAPMNDLLGLAITEGIEDALSVHQATGLGAWAAGSAPLMPNLAAAVERVGPDCVTVFADDDDTGRRSARALAAALSKLTQVFLREAAP